MAESTAEKRRNSLGRNRDFLLLWSGQAVSTLGTSVSTLALPLLALALTRSATQAGFIAAAQAVPYLILSLPAGALIDRWDRRAVMIRCDLARWLAYGSVPLAEALGRLTVAQLYGVALVSGTAFVFFNIAEVAALPRVVPAAQLPRANALNESALFGATLLGPALSGALISLARTTIAGAALAYLLDSLSYLASVASLGFIRTPFQMDRPSVAAQSLRRDIAAGLHFLWADQRLRSVALLAASIGVLSSPTDLAIIVLAQQHLHADARTIGLILSLGSVGGLLGSVIAPWVTARLRFGRIIVGTVVIEALAVALLAAATVPAMLVVGLAVVAVAIPIANVTQMSYRLTLTPDALQGRVNSVFRLLFFGGQPLGLALGGALLGPLGPRAELGLVAVGLGLSALAVALTPVGRV